jgi:phosphoribosylcarboxyaminoimidazole (NCAIR) mutase
MQSTTANNAALDALWWVVAQPEYITVTRDPSPDENRAYFELDVFETTDSGLGDEVVSFRCDTRDEVLDKLVAWRVEQRLAS